MTAAPLEFFFSFRSPYSYLAAPRAFALPERFDVDVLFRGVIPMAMRGQSVPRAKRLHTLRDVKREATRLGMPFGHCARALIPHRLLRGQRRPASPRQPVENAEHLVHAGQHVRL